MKILPSRTEPPEAPHLRRHQPREEGGRFFYQTFRGCLRWDFGFTCAFCLLHERDLMHDGTEGWRVMTAEHFEPQRLDQKRANDYSNCYWCCTRCNSSRGSRPVGHAEGRLLDPCATAWRQLFRLNDDFELVARSEEDRDAKRTVRVYDFNDPQKVVRRKKRFQAIRGAWALYWRTLEIFDLLDQSQHNRSRGLRILREQQEHARRELRRWGALPEDPPDTCSCKSADARNLPKWLARQCDELTSD